jgi:hypothetical protein
MDGPSQYFAVASQKVTNPGVTGLPLAITVAVKVTFDGNPTARMGFNTAVSVVLVASGDPKSCAWAAHSKEKKASDSLDMQDKDFLRGELGFVYITDIRRENPTSEKFLSEWHRMS